MNDKLKKKNNNTEFENIVLLIQDARIRAFAKVNAELVLLYFKVGDIISAKVSEGVWGDGTVDELAAFIQKKIPGLSGFNRRGLYRMKQFYETYTVEEFVSPLATYLQTYLKDKSQSQFVSAVSTQIQKEKKVSKGGAQKPAKNAGKPNVSAVPTHLDGYDSLHNQFVSEVLTQIAWSSHMDTEVVEYAMARNISPELVADYETKLIPKRVLANKLHQLVEQLSKENID